MPEQTLALVAALLRRGRELDRLSAALTLLAIGLGLYQAVQGIGWRYFAAAMLAIALLGLWQKYWALRVALDAELFAGLVVPVVGPSIQRSNLKSLPMLESVVAYGIIAGARAITGLRSLWLGTTPIPKQRIYYANHSSHGDFVLLWASLPPEVRRRTRPVAGADYWNKAGLRSYVINKVFNGVLVDRQRSEANANPLEPLDRALDGGDSLIIFPEGTRNLDDEVKLLPFKSGIYHLSLAHPDVELVPVWLANLNRVMPKGRMLPLPLLCTLSFGKPLVATAEEGKEAFLERARMALLDLAPEEEA